MMNKLFVLSLISSIPLAAIAAGPNICRTNCPITEESLQKITDDNKSSISHQIVLYSLLSSSIKSARFVNHSLGVDRPIALIALPMVLASAWSTARWTTTTTAIPEEQRLWLRRLDLLLDQETRLQSRYDLLSAINADDITIYRARAKLVEAQQILEAHKLVQPKIQITPAIKFANHLRSWPVAIVGGLTLSYFLVGETVFISMDAAKLDAYIQALDAEVSALHKLLVDIQAQNNN